ncbi:MAG: uncharacterized protein KVP18_003636 [Porospora cf. gigantea A]|uniref:uncharacterized protein n=1 Tax=Porospora cf. gigantea A TaxID=2853593 RepID=UPI003559D5F3|nr:MAG: hypothetical protein KVP18_003636 [Porospora cf. gigantea A]
MLVAFLLLFSTLSLEASGETYTVASGSVDISNPRKNCVLASHFAVKGAQKIDGLDACMRQENSIKAESKSFHGLIGNDVDVMIYRAGSPRVSEKGDHVTLEVVCPFNPKLHVTLKAAKTHGAIDRCSRDDGVSVELLHLTSMEANKTKSPFVILLRMPNPESDQELVLLLDRRGKIVDSLASRGVSKWAKVRAAKGVITTGGAARMPNAVSRVTAPKPRVPAVRPGSAPGQGGGGIRKHWTVKPADRVITTGGASRMPSPPSSAKPGRFSFKKSKK